MGDVDMKIRSVPVSFVQRHTEEIEGETFSDSRESCRMKDRMPQTVLIAFVLCPNVGVNPTDVVKPNPCARLECWIDPNAMSPQKAKETIRRSLRKQYEQWQPRAKYRYCLDPTVNDVEKMCTLIRRSVNDKRVLLHYNGHGVPNPTELGEIWVFDKNFKNYVPLRINDLQTWMGCPSVYVYDCNCAGLALKFFNELAAVHMAESQGILYVASSSS